MMVKSGRRRLVRLSGWSVELVGPLQDTILESRVMHCTEIRGGKEECCELKCSITGV